MLPLLGAACVEKPHHWRSCLYIDQLADQLVLEICHIITHISSDFFSYLESTMPISVKLCMGLVEQKTFAVTWSSPCGMHISIDAIGTLNNAVQMLSTGLDWVSGSFDTTNRFFMNGILWPSLTLSGVGRWRMSTKKVLESDSWQCCTSFPI